MRLTKLEDIETLKPFDCGDDDLNEFLAVDAMFYRKQMLANTFVLEDDEQTIAYYSLLNDKISNSTVTKNLWRKCRATIRLPFTAARVSTSWNTNRPNQTDRH